MGATRWLRSRFAASRRRGPRTIARFARDDLRFLLRHGPDTFTAPRRAGAGRHADGERSEPVRVSTARLAFDHLPDGFRGKPLVDVGCGRGRLLLLALDHGFSPVVGVEVDRDHVEVARRAVRERARVVVADAASWPFPDDTAVVAFANPFGPGTLADALARLQESRDRRPRPVAIVYINPVHLGVVQAAGYEVTWSNEDVAVLGVR